MRSHSPPLPVPDEPKYDPVRDAGAVTWQRIVIDEEDGTETTWTEWFDAAGANIWVTVNGLPPDVIRPSRPL